MKEKLVLERGIQDIFSPKSGYTAAEGDLVALSGNLTVAKASLGCPFPLGRVIVTAAGVINNGKLTVRTDYGSLRNIVAGEALIAGPVVLGADGKAYKWSRSTANGSQTVTFATNATGDGAHTITIDGVAISYSPAAASSPTTTAAAVVALINASPELVNKGFFASNSAGVLTVSCVGKTNHGASVVAATTDSAQTVVAGGATITGGAGYPMEAVYGLCITATSSASDAPVLTKE